MKRHLTRWVFLILGLGCLAPAWASDLSEVYRLSVQNDPQYKAAQAANRAAQEARPQARSGLLPSVNLGASTDWNEQTGTNGNRNYNTHGWTLSISQPVFRYDRWMQLSQADSRINQADAELAFAGQDLIIRVATRYFDVLSAADNLEYARNSKTAIGQQRRQSQQRFEVGLIAITDVEEARARYDLAVADEIAAENQLANAREALREVSGEYHGSLSALSAEVPLVSPEPNNIDRWTETALNQNLQLLASRYAVESAGDEIKVRQAGHYPTLDLVGSHEYTSSGPRPFSLGGTIPGSQSHTNTIGLQLNVPLYSGGLVSSRTEEARHLYDQAVDNMEVARRSTQRQTRESFLGVLAAISKVKALKQALTSTQTALEATEAGFQVGTRTSVDVVVAQQEMYKARRDYKAAKYAYILNTLQLKQAAGTVAEDDLTQVNAWLKQ